MSLVENLVKSYDDFKIDIPRWEILDQGITALWGPSGSGKNAIIHNITDGIVVCDASGNLILFNNATREFHGLPVESLPPEQWAEHFDLYQPDGKTLLSKTEVPLFRALQFVRGKEHTT